MPTYTLPRQSWQDFKSTFLKVTALVALAAIGPLAMAYAFDPYAFVFLLAMFVVVFAIAIALAVSRRSRSELTIDHDQLTLKYPGKPDVNILRSDIRTIADRPGFGINVVSSTTNSTIFIPKDLTGYENIRSELSSWHPIEPESEDGKRSLVLMISLIAISGIAAVGAFLFRIKAFFFVFGATFLIIMIMGVVLSFKDRTEKKRKAGPIDRIVLGIVVIYFLYKIVESLIH